MEENIECGEFVFIRNFDSGNLGHVEQTPREDIVPGLNYKTNIIETPEYEFNIWMKPDCVGTEFENGNRTWFYFGVKCSLSSVLVKFNLVNLNRQGKMYSQGMAPVTKVVPGRPHWERIKDKPVYFLDDNNFTLSFKFTTPEDTSAVTYFAFTYPYTYTELQASLNMLDLKVEKSHLGNDDDIYFCRECLCYSLEKRRVDLLTISSRHGITNKREDKLKNLFPDNNERPFKFLNKKIIFISARVHPGETPSSFVFNGFLNLLMNRHDPVAIVLRRLYVFKLIPFLNPDGVAKGHYRTDTRGVNLNRVYQSPSFEYHPSVYAARALIRYHHFGFEKSDSTYDSDDYNSFSCSNSLEQNPENIAKELDIKNENIQQENCYTNVPKLKLTIDSEDDTSCSMSTNNTTLIEKVEDLNLNQSSVDGFNIIPSDNECTMDNIPNMLFSNINDNVNHDDNSDVIVSPQSLTSSKCTKPEKSIENPQKPNPTLSMTNCFRLNQPWCTKCKLAVKDLESKMPGISRMIPKVCKNNDSSKNDKPILCINCQSPINDAKSTQNEKLIKKNLDLGDINSNNSSLQRNNKNNPKNKEVEKKFKVKSKTNNVSKDKDSELFLYIDLHGHASKKGIFMYGNHFEEIDSSVECMLLPRIMSLNNMHFHFTSCNFTERNMYLKDRRDGMSREGSGRVAVLKATGLMRSYTLECNYNTGKSVNVLPPTVKESMTTGSMPTPLNVTPPKYTPSLFEDVGKSLGSSILDLTSNHPNSRIPASEHRNLHGIREWLRLHSRQIKPSQIIGARQSTSACTIRTSTPRPSRSHIRLNKQQTFVDPERKENLATPGFQLDGRMSSSRLSSMKRQSSLKLLPIRELSSKTQRNVSLISIKKPTVTKHPPSFKAPNRNKSPSAKLRFKQKSSEEPDIIKSTIRSLTDSNRGKESSFKVAKSSFKSHKDNPEAPTTSISHRKVKIRSKEAFQKQPGQTSSKPLIKRLKVSQYIKYSDNAKEKYRIRKPSNKNITIDDGVSGSVTSSGEDSALPWETLRVTAGSSGLSCNPQTPATKRSSFKSQRLHLSSANDLGTIRSKFV